MTQLTMMNQNAQTPLMRQYYEIKKQCPEAILFFRLGDFYEMFFEDAVTAAPVLDIALTSRDKNAKNPIPLCGVPFHSAQSYIVKLLDAGHKVAICEQVEAPSAGKKIVKREIVRLITPATRTDQEGLASDQVNYIAALVQTSRGITVVWMDIHEGVVEYAHHLSSIDAKHIIQNVKPAELICFDSKLGTQFVDEPEVLAKPPLGDVKHAVLARYGVNHTSVLGLESCEDVLLGVYGLIEYVEHINLTTIGQLERPSHFEKSAFVMVDEMTQKNLELFSRTAPSLMKVLNYTQSPGGARCLQSWISRPLRDIEKIQTRLETVAHLTASQETCRKIQSLMRNVRDMQRLMGRVMAGKAFVRDVVAIRSTLAQIPHIKKTLEESGHGALQDIASTILDIDELYTELSRALHEEPSLTLSDGGVIAAGYSADLDHVRQLAQDNTAWIASLQQQERDKTGIPTLKVGYNRVFGYFLEVGKAHHAKVPSTYIRKQTLVNAERYITPELKEKEEEILGAKQKMHDIEALLFAEVVTRCQSSREALMHNHQRLSELDVLCSFATAALQHQLVQPVVNQEKTIDIKQGRHPIVEASLSDTPFVPNDVLLDDTEQSFILLTGPNMAGKSTVMRQVALIVLMAQMGCFVPAASAKIGLVDQVFTRIGAQDDVTQGRSTFMVEMNETAHILQTASDRSLVLLDEIGRGTSTYDGVSIAWAVSSHLHNKINAKTIFATHYHELVELADTHPRLRCFKMQVRTWKDEIVFLRKMEAGSVQRSYGIEVAQLAGVPAPVIESAKTILQHLEKPKALPAEAATKMEAPVAEHRLEKILSNFHPDEMSPKQALEFLYQLKAKV